MRQSFGPLNTTSLFDFLTFSLYHFIAFSRSFKTLFWLHTWLYYILWKPNIRMPARTKIHKSYFTIPTSHLSIRRIIILIWFLFWFLPRLCWLYWNWYPPIRKPEKIMHNSHLSLCVRLQTEYQSVYETQMITIVSNGKDILFASHVTGKLLWHLICYSKRRCSITIGVPWSGLSCIFGFLLLLLSKACYFVQWTWIYNLSKRTNWR